jgi:hypothetical protein
MAVQRVRRIGVASARKKLAANHKSLSQGLEHTYQREGETRMPLAFEIFVVVTKWVVLVAIAHSLYLTLHKSKE